MTTARAVHIDTDPGLDDLLALATALASPEIEVVGITSVAGNAAIEAVTENLQRFLTLCGVDLPVGRGSGAPRALSPAYSAHAFGPDGRRGVPLPALDRRPLPAAVDVLRGSLERGARQLIALGPLTNVAALLEQDPGCLREVEVVWMGGALEAGNVTPHAEHNCYLDPRAAEEVLGGAAVRLIGLDVTRHVQLCSEDLAEPAFGSGRSGRFLDRVLRSLMESERPLHGGACATLHDPAAVLGACDPDLFRYEQRSLGIDVVEGARRGRMCEALPGTRRLGGRVAVEAHVPELRRRIRDRLCAWAESCT